MRTFFANNRNSIFTLFYRIMRAEILSWFDKLNQLLINPLVNCPMEVKIVLPFTYITYCKKLSINYVRKFYHLSKRQKELINNTKTSKQPNLVILRILTTTTKNQMEKLSILFRQLWQSYLLLLLIWLVNFNLFVKYLPHFIFYHFERKCRT